MNERKIELHIKGLSVFGDKVDADSYLREIESILDGNKRLGAHVMLVFWH